MKKSLILNNKQISRKIKRIALQIVENNYYEEEIYLVGIKPKGEILAHRLMEELKTPAGTKITLETLTLDKNEPLKKPIECSFDAESIAGKTVILVDDVLNTGKTLVYAAGYLLQSEPKTLQTVTLIDRRHRKFPVRADYVGLTLATTLQEHIEVSFGEEDAAWLK